MYNDSGIEVVIMGKRIGFQKKSGDIIDKDKIEKIFSLLKKHTDVFEKLVASAKVVKLAHDKYPQFKMGNMSIMATSYAYTCNPDDIIANQKNMQINNWYCADVQVRGAYPYFAKRYWKEKGIDIKMEPDDEKTLREGKVAKYILKINEIIQNY